MVLENLGLGFAWNWLYGGSSSKDSAQGREGRVLKKKPIRRADQLAAARAERNLTEGYYPGLINISGTYCFMNSTVQALASLSYLQPYLEVIHSRAERFDVPTPVLDALLELLTELNTPIPSSRALRPVALINTLSAPNDKGRRSALFSSREHQDAQELFQLLSETIKNEAKAVDDEASRDPGLGDLKKEVSPEVILSKGSVFDGLTANRRSCMECGYTEAVMHFAFDNLQLTVPRMASCRLEDCLTDYTRLELLNDCICRKCSMLATYERLKAESAKIADAISSAISEGGSGSVSMSKKKKAKEAKKLEGRVKAALEEGRIEEDLKDVKMEKVYSRCSTKQSMIARPPPVLALHLNRSIHYGMSGVKNTCRVIFPELLDLTPFTTSGKLSTQPSLPISSPAPARRPSTPTPSDPQTSSSRYAPQVLYRLSSVVCHYGTHSFGHYVSYRRKPRPLSAGEHRFDPPTLQCPLGCECDKCKVWGPIRDDDVLTKEQGDDLMGKGTEMPGYTQSRWLRISDDSVDEVGIERVLAENAGTFMLYYERLVSPGETTSVVPAKAGSASSTPVAISQQERHQLPISAGSLGAFPNGTSPSSMGFLSSPSASIPIPNGTPPSLIRTASDRSFDPMAASTSALISTLSTSYSSSNSSSLSSTSSSIWPARGSPRSSEETITPSNLHSHSHHSSPHPNGPDAKDRSRPRFLEARIIRNVYAGRRFGGTPRDSSPASILSTSSETLETSDGGHVRNGDPLTKSMPHLPSNASAPSLRSRSHPRNIGRSSSPASNVTPLAAGLRA
ncbi:hypothetical protein M422DRAFT_23274 [Sphaerobolus stellatus SS14]|nr:hypothetical protein M422DRAFT_23274 [Sphaerobolus stellatus SS14]